MNKNHKNSSPRNSKSIGAMVSEMEAAGVKVPYGAPRQAFPRAVATAYAKWRAATAPRAAVKPAAAPQPRPQRKQEQEEQSPYAPGSRFIASRTKAQLCDAIVARGGRDPINGSKNALARALSEIAGKASVDLARELGNSAMAIASRRNRWKAKAVEAAQVGIVLSDEERRTGLYRMDNAVALDLAHGDPLESLWRAAAPSWTELVLDVLVEAASAPVSLGCETWAHRQKLQGIPWGNSGAAHEELNARPRVDEEFADSIQDELLRGHMQKRRTEGRDKAFVKKAHRKARGQRRAELPAEPVVISLIDSDVESNPGRW
jgi:hypothetical protein